MFRTVANTARRCSRAYATGAGIPPAFRLDGKVVINCGAGNPAHEGHGIGATTSIVLSRLGATVVSVSNNEENCNTVTAAVDAEGVLNGGMAHVADCTKPSDVDALADAVVKKYGRVDVLINSGVHSALPMGFKKLDLAAWEKGIDLNMNAHFHLCKRFMPVFEAQQSGNIIFFTSVASSVGLGMVGQRHAYAAGKAAASTLTRRIGLEMAKKGIRANVIGVGYTNGPLVDRAVKQAGADLAKVTATRDSYVPRGKQVSPEEVANTAAFLASDASSAINAAEIYVDGGSHVCTYGP